MNASALTRFNAQRLADVYALHGSGFSIITSSTTLSVTGILSARDTGREWDDQGGGYRRDHRLRAQLRKASVANLTREILETCQVRIVEGSTSRGYMIDRVTDDTVAAEWILDCRAARDGT
jgi:hypothetical protein